MFFESTRWPGETHVSRALISEPLGQEATEHVHYENHVPWLDFDDDLPKKLGQGS
jgi:hypothetical protein